MGIPHIHQKLEDNGAACFWGRIESVSASNGQPTVHRWVDEINDRDYLAKCVADDAYAMWMPRYNLANGGVPSDNRFNMVIPGAGSSYQSAQLGLSSGGSLNWGRMIVPALAGQNVGFYGESGDLSPLARRTKAQQTYPNDSPKPEALPGSWSLEAQACFVAEHAGSNKIVESFPFTLECWAKPTAANVGEAPSASGKPGCALMVAPPNNPESPNTAISAPGAGWKCWGVGFKDDSSNPGVPVVFWGGWEGHDALYQAGPDPGRTKYPTSSSGPTSAEWQHVVAVFHSASHVQLFWNGREVGNYNNSDFTSFRDQNGSNQTWSGKTVTNPSSYSYSQAPGLTAWMGGCNWFYDPGSGSTPPLEKQFPLAGKFAFPAVYRKALSNREVMHHFLTCRQAANITLRGEAQDYSGSAPQGVLKVERTKVSGLGRSDQILIYKDQITTGQASMEISADGKAAIQQCGLPDPFPYLSGVTDDRRYHDGTQGGFTGYCIAGAIGAIFDSSIATIANGFMAPMSWIGRPQWGVSGQELSTPTGMQVPLFSSTNSLQRNAFLYADLQDPKNAADRATGTVRVTAINSSKDSRLGTQVFSAKYENGKVLEIGTQHEPELAVASSTSDVGTLRLADSSGDGAWDYLTLVSGTETPLVIGPHALIGSPMPTQTVIRMLGGTPKLRSRQATGLVRRHYEINNMPPATRQAGNKTASQAPATQTTIGTLSISGPQTANEDTATSFSVSRSGNSNTITYAWSCSPSATVVASAENATITFPDPSTTYTVSVTATDSNSSDTPKSASQQLTTNAALATIGTVTISGPTTGDEDTALAYTATRSGNSNSITWTWSSSPAATIVASAASASITFPDPSTTYTITAQAVDSAASDTPKSDTHTLTTNAAAAATDWDTYADGVFTGTHYFSERALTTVDVSDSYTDATTSRAFNPMIRINIPNASAPPMIALWYHESENWASLVPSSTQGSPTTRTDYDATGTIPPTNQDKVITLVYQTQVTSNISGWTDYDPGFTPLLVGNCVAWFDADDASTITGTTNVSNWADKSGNSVTVDLGQSTSSLQPSLNSGGLNSKNTIFFDGSEALKGKIPHSISSASVFIVGKPQSGETTWLYLNEGGSNYSDVAQAGSSSTTVRSNFGSPDNYVTGNDASWSNRSNVSTSLSGSSHIYEAVNCNLTAFSNSSASREYTLAGYDTSTYSFAGDIGEVLMFEKALTLAQRELIEGYLAHKWGMAADLPEFHPYRVNAPTYRDLDWDTSGYATLFAANYSDTGSNVATITYAEDYSKTFAEFRNNTYYGITATSIQYKASGVIGINLGGIGGINAINAGKSYPYAAYYTAAGGWRILKSQVGGTSQTDFRFEGVVDSAEADDFPSAFLLFSSFPGDYSGWRNYDGPLNYDTRQTITYTQVSTDWRNQTVSNFVGDEILQASGNSGAQAVANATSANTQPRFIFGSYTSGFSTSEVADMWNGLRIEYSFAGGARKVLGAPVGISSNQTSYINSSPRLDNTSGLAVGETISYFVSALGYDWDTFANGVYGVDDLRTGASSLKAIPGYPATTYGDTMTSMWVTSVTGGYVPTSSHYITSHDGDESPYIAVYINEYADDVENIGGSSAKGWYVFKNDIPSTGTYDRTSWETPVAWPSDTSTSRVASENASGYLGSNAGLKPGFIVVLLDDYKGTTGSGGTDRWTKPPVVWYGDVTSSSGSNSIVVENGAYLSSGSYKYAQVYNGFDIGPYGYTDFVSPGDMRFGVVNDVGTMDFEVYLNGTKTHTASKATSSIGTNIVSLVNVAYANYSTFKSNVSTGDEIIVVAHYTLREQ